MSTPTPPQAEPMPEREERELAALYRQLPAQEPDPALDARVLDAARRAAARRPPRYRGLLLAVAGVATLAMAAGLAWRLQGVGRVPVPGPASPASGQATRAPAIAPIREVVPVRILTGEGKARSAPAERTSPPGPAAREPTQASEKSIRVVVPVHIIPAGKAQAHADAAAAAPEPANAPSLIVRARSALQHKDVARARMLVRAWMDRHPGEALPADLARLKPLARRPGSP